MSTQQRMMAGTPQATRSVAQYAYWLSTPISVLAGWESLSGLQKNGNSGSLSGVDGCAPPAPTLPGVAVPTVPGYMGDDQSVAKLISEAEHFRQN